MKLEETLDWIENIRTDIENANSKLMDMIDEVAGTLKQLKSKQPYHINVIDELHVNENANSRILAKLFQFQNEAGEYEILQSFVRYMQQQSFHTEEFKRIVIDRPLITQEKERIDIWIRDTSYALILENKIYDAGDQEAQLARYIQKTLAHGYGLKQIFVIYMPSSSCEPSEQTWILTDERGTSHHYAEEFRDRYLNLSFREHILPWLKKEIIPNVRTKDHYLLNALNQYVDYLEGMFYLREIDRNLNMKMQELLSKKLELDKKESLEEKYRIVRDKINEINDIVSQLNILSNSICRQKINDIVGKYKFVQKSDSRYLKCVIIINEVEYKLYTDKYGSQFFCQFQREDQQSIQEYKSQKNLQALFPQTSKGQQYAIWKLCNDYFDTLILFEKAIEILSSMADKLL